MVRKMVERILCLNDLRPWEYSMHSVVGVDRSCEVQAQISLVCRDCPVDVASSMLDGSCGEEVEEVEQGKQ